MRRYIKVTLWTVGALLALLIAAAVVVILLFDPNNYKAEIAAATYGATGRDLAIQGDVKLSMFPWLGVEIGAMALSNAAMIWEDQKDQAHFELNKLSLYTGPISPNSPVTLELDTNIRSSAPAFTAHLDIATEALNRVNTRRLHLQGLKLSAQTGMSEATADDAKLTLNSEADLDFAAGHYQINTLQVLASLRGAALPGKQLDASLSGNIVADLKNNGDNF